MKLLRVMFRLLLWARQSVFVVYMLIISIIFALSVVILGICRAPLSWRLAMPTTWSKLSRFGILVLLQLRVRIEGGENTLKQPCVYVAKHQSAWETIVFHGLMPKIAFVLKKELLKIPLFGRGLQAADSIPIDRAQSLKSFKNVLSAGKDRLARGMRIVIFPEGTRVPVGRYPKFHKTAMTLAKSTGALIIPVSHNSGVFWPRKFGLIKPGVITLTYGEPIDPKNYTVDELNDYCYEWINERVKKIGG